MGPLCPSAANGAVPQPLQEEPVGFEITCINHASHATALLRSTESSGSPLKMHAVERARRKAHLERRAGCASTLPNTLCFLSLSLFVLRGGALPFGDELTSHCPTGTGLKGGGGSINSAGAVIHLFSL